ACSYAHQTRHGVAAGPPTAPPGSADGPTGTAQGRRPDAEELSDPASATLYAAPRERPARSSIASEDRARAARTGRIGAAARRGTAQSAQPSAAAVEAQQAA